MTETRGAVRAGVGCGAALGFAVAVMVVTFGGVLLHTWIDPTYTGSGVGQGEGVIAALVLLATPVVGALAAWRPWAGAASALLILGALVALHVAAIVSG